MKIIDAPVEISTLIHRILQLQQLGFIEHTVTQYQRQVQSPSGEIGSFVFTESFITTASDEEFQTAIAETQAYPVAPVRCSSTVN